MVKHAIRRKAARAVGRSRARAAGDADDADDGGGDADDADAMATLAPSHRRKVKKRAKFLESACAMMRTRRARDATTRRAGGLTARRRRARAR